MVSAITQRSSVYNLRTKSEGDKKLSSSDRISRKILTPSKSASLIGKIDHHCDLVDEESTLTKVQTRLAYSIHRFAIAFSWGCETSRGKTQYNGARAHCGVGKCEAGHAALTPTLYDNMLKRISEEFQTKTFLDLDEILQSYIKQRFALKQEDIESLSDLNIHDRISFFQGIVRRLTSQEHRGSFVGTSVEFQRNATYNNPKSSNRLDCYLERVLREVEDNLAQMCQKKEKNPEQALLALQEKYKLLLNAAFADLNTDDIRVDQLHKAWLALSKSQAVLETQDDERVYQEYIACVKQYITVYETRKNEPLKGSPKLQAMMDYFRKNPSYYVLKGLLREHTNSLDDAKVYFSKNKDHLKMASEDEQKFEEGKSEIAKRLDEVKIQQTVINASKESLHNLFKNMFGTKEEALLKTPSQKEIAKKLVETLPSLTPSRSDLQRKFQAAILAPPALT